MAVPTDGNYVVNFQERVQQLERQLKEMEKEKERELNALRKERRELVHTTQTVREIGSIVYCFRDTMLHLSVILQNDNFLSQGFSVYKASKI